MGRPSTLIVRGTFQAAALMTEASDELASIIRGASSTDAVNAALTDWTQSTAIFDRIGDVLFVTTALADMGGQLMVAGREAQVITMAAGDPLPTPKPSPKPFLDLPWSDAIEAFKARGLVSETDFETLLGDYAQRSAVARQLMLEQVQSEVMRHLTDAIAKGETFPEFADKVNGRQDLADPESKPGLMESLGLAPAKPSYLQMVFRTNVQSAYGAGRFKAITNPVIAQSRPFVQYRTVGDARVRDEHAVLDGKTYAVDDPVWLRIAPPNGFQCRCAFVTLSKAQAVGLDISTDIPDGYIPTPGFDQPPSAVLTVTAEPAEEKESG